MPSPRGFMVFRGSQGSSAKLSGRTRDASRTQQPLGRIRPPGADAGHFAGQQTSNVGSSAPNTAVENCAPGPMLCTTTTEWTQYGTVDSPAMVPPTSPLQRHRPQASEKQSSGRAVVIAGWPRTAPPSTEAVARRRGGEAGVVPRLCSYSNPYD
jgi:hypothetical protein